MPNLDRPAYCDWEIGWWFTSSVRFSLPKALQMTYCELCWKLTEDGGATRKDVPMLARLLMDTEENVRTILALPHFFDNPDGTFSHRTVDQKLAEQRDRRMAGKKAVEARWEKVKEQKRTPRNTGRNTPRNTPRNTSGNANEGLLEGLPESKTTSQNGPSGTSAGRSASVPSGHSAGGHPVKKPIVPGARVPTVWRDNDLESEAVLSVDGTEWISTTHPNERIKVRR